MPASVTDFVDPKGNTHELLTLAKNADDQWPFKFGVGKAILAIEHMGDIAEYIKDKAPDQFQRLVSEGYLEDE
jgi:hypothetical protein|tara:strand:- start:576 stop:794 length:219 start_codon:yes stop_codon:yes gene_type:complete